MADPQVSLDDFIQTFTTVYESTVPIISALEQQGAIFRLAGLPIGEAAQDVALAVRMLTAVLQKAPEIIRALIHNGWSEVVPCLTIDTETGLDALTALDAACMHYARVAMRMQHQSDATRALNSACTTALPAVVFRLRILIQKGI